MSVARSKRSETDCKGFSAKLVIFSLTRSFSSSPTIFLSLNSRHACYRQEIARLREKTGGVCSVLQTSKVLPVQGVCNVAPSSKITKCFCCLIFRNLGCHWIWATLRSSPMWMSEGVSYQKRHCLAGIQCLSRLWLVVGTGFHRLSGRHKVLSLCKKH